MSMLPVMIQEFKCILRHRNKRLKPVNKTFVHELYTFCATKKLSALNTFGSDIFQ